MSETPNQLSRISPTASDDRAVAGTRTLKYLPVAIFPTSTFRRVGGPIRHGGSATAGYWFIEAPSYPIGGPVVTPRRTAPPPPVEHMHFFLHTRAGIRRYDIGPAGAAPEAPSQIQLAFYEVNCHLRTRDWTKREQLQWLLDPPPGEYGIRALRQSMLTFRNLPPRGSLRIEQVGGRRPVGPQLRTFGGSASGVIELVTDEETELVIEHDLGDSDAEVRIAQRWLLPTQVIRLAQPAENIGSVAVAGRQRMATVTAGGRTQTLGVEGLTHGGECAPSKRASQAGSVLSVSLPNGEVVAAWEDHLVVAVPWGTRTVPTLAMQERNARH